MKSARFKEYGEALEMMEESTPEPQGSEVLVRISGCGVCHSDLHIWDGHFDLGGGNKVDIRRGRKLPFTLGHEIVGEVVALGPDAQGCAIGDRAVVYPWIGCGDCEICANGMEHICAKPRQLGVQVDGGYSDHVMVPHSRYLFDFGNVDEALACTYACSGLTAYSAINKVRERVQGRSLLIVGAGGVGLAGLGMAPAMLDTTIMVADIDAGKRIAAKENGADYVVDPNDPDAAKQIRSALGGGAAAAVDFVGAGPSVSFAFGALAPLGTLVVVGLFGGTATLPTAMFPLKSATIMGSMVGSLAEMAEMMELVRTGKVKPLPIATRPLEQADQTLRDLQAGKIIGRTVLQA